MDNAHIGGIIAGRIMSILQGTSLYKDAEVIKGIDFDEVAESVQAHARGSRTLVDIEIENVKFRLAYRKEYLMYQREVWDTRKIQDIVRMLRYLQNIVAHDFILIAGNQA